MSDGPQNFMDGRRGGRRGGGDHAWHDDTPFPQRWRSYLVLKVAVLVLAALVVVWYFGVL